MGLVQAVQEYFQRFCRKIYCKALPVLAVSHYPANPTLGPTAPRWQCDAVEW